ncbi:MAG: peptidoglycan editing factor PgeF [Nitrospirae bacterium]|nr:peptidoglycan editing factor PgeF [Nitrospirota bacterium]
MQFINPANILSSDVKAFFTTKAFNNGGIRINDALSEEFNVLKENVYLPIQKHTNKIHVLDHDDEPVVADAVITDRKHTLIGVLVADCVPILLYDGKRRVIGAVHAGWRGTTEKILKEAIKTMQEKFECSPKDISVALGPSIRLCSYEVGEDVKIAVQQATGVGDYFHQKGYKHFVDLSTANKIQALSMEVPRENIWQSDECTFCNPEKFYSYRYAKESNGRQGGFIGMW